MSDSQSEQKSPAILVIHGPNLNMLGLREPEIYGSTGLAEIDAGLKAFGEKLGLRVSAFQANSEGAIIDAIQSARSSIAGLIINPAGYTHTSVAIRDALLLLEVPIIEVHLSNIHKRENFRHRSITAGAATGQVMGLGPQGYSLALQAIAGLISAVR
ncbi:MAG: type II 3-dehydroquinate dehydratase [Desulfosarcinaceae bacterium]